MSMSVFSKTIMNQKYSHVMKNGKLEDWENIAYRVAKHIMKAVDASPTLVARVQKFITEKKFIPGGRYLYATGRPFHQTQNCLLLRAEDSREGWADHLSKAAMGLMTGAGIGCEYSEVRGEGKPIRKTGGFATGPIALMQMTNECGRGIMQGGSRRSALWAGLSWSHPDIMKFIQLKNWSPEVRALKAKDFNFPATMDGTNISVGLDDEFFEAFHDEKHVLHSHAHSVYGTTIRQMLKTGEPGFSINCGKNSKEVLRNAPVCGETRVLTHIGYQEVKDLVDTPSVIWTGLHWAPDVVFKETSARASIVKVTMSGGREIRCDESHPFFVEKYRGKGKDRRILTEVRKVPANELMPGDTLHVSLPGHYITTSLEDVDGYTLGYIYGDGSFANNRAEITFCTVESKECAKTVSEASLLSSINWNDGRGYVRAYFKASEWWTGREKEIFPTDVYTSSKSFAAAFLAGLFDADGNWEPTQHRIRLASKHEGFLRGVALLLEQYGILAGVSKAGTSTFGKAQGYQLVVMSEYNQKFLDFVPTIRLKINLDGYSSYRPATIKVLSVEDDGYSAVYCANVKMPEHSFQAEGVIISNCTEVTSETDSDICNLGSVNLAAIESLEEMEEAVELGTAFLLAGTIYSDVPYPRVDQVRQKNRRLGLGLMGIHEWLIKHGGRYDRNDELAKFLGVYARSGRHAKLYADKWDLSVPVKTRAIAPTGTIGIIAETTTGIEPIFCSAYKRRYLKGSTWHHQYVLDPTAKKLVDNGVNPDTIEDAYSLAEDVERRVAFNAWVQEYVDHSISSTINLPAWGSELNNDSTVQKFGKMLIKYLPSLRGLTVYPDGARGGQPLTAISYRTAEKHVGEITVEASDICDITKGGTCGS
jgi:ribonucleotide reductase alpha subunit